MDTHNVIILDLGDERFSGEWTLIGARLLVASPYGDIRTTLRETPADVEPIARRLLRELVEDWLEGPDAISH